MPPRQITTQVNHTPSVIDHSDTSSDSGKSPEAGLPPRGTREDHGPLYKSTGRKFFEKTKAALGLTDEVKTHAKEQARQQHVQKMHAERGRLLSIQATVDHLLVESRVRRLSTEEIATIRQCELHAAKIYYGLKDDLNKEGKKLGVDSKSRDAIVKDARKIKKSLIAAFDELDELTVTTNRSDTTTDMRPSLADSMMADIQNSLAGIEALADISNRRKLNEPETALLLERRDDVLGTYNDFLSKLTEIENSSESWQFSSRELQKLRERTQNEMNKINSIVSGAIEGPSRGTTSGSRRTTQQSRTPDRAGLNILTRSDANQIKADIATSHKIIQGLSGQSDTRDLSQQELYTVITHQKKIEELSERYLSRLTVTESWHGPKDFGTQQLRTMREEVFITQAEIESSVDKIMQNTTRRASGTSTPQSEPTMDGPAHLGILEQNDQREYHRQAMIFSKLVMQSATEPLNDMEFHDLLTVMSGMAEINRKCAERLGEPDPNSPEAQERHYGFIDSISASERDMDAAFQTVQTKYSGQTGVTMLLSSADEVTKFESAMTELVELNNLKRPLNDVEMARLDELTERIEVFHAAASATLATMEAEGEAKPDVAETARLLRTYFSQSVEQTNSIFEEIDNRNDSASSQFDVETVRDSTSPADSRIPEFSLSFAGERLGNKLTSFSLDGVNSKILGWIKLEDEETPPQHRLQEIAWSNANGILTVTVPRSMLATGGSSTKEFTHEGKPVEKVRINIQPAAAPAVRDVEAGSPPVNRRPTLRKTKRGTEDIPAGRQRDFLQIDSDLEDGVDSLWYRRPRRAPLENTNSAAATRPFTVPRRTIDSSDDEEAGLQPTVSQGIDATRRRTQNQPAIKSRRTFAGFSPPVFGTVAGKGKEIEIDSDDEAPPVGRQGLSREARQKAPGGKNMGAYFDDNSDSDLEPVVVRSNRYVEDGDEGNDGIGSDRVMLSEDEAAKPVPTRKQKETDTVRRAPADLPQSSSSGSNTAKVEPVAGSSKDGTQKKEE
jgi:hypothetical protein